MTHDGSAPSRARVPRQRSTGEDRTAVELVAVLEGARAGMARLLALLDDERMAAPSH